MNRHPDPAVDPPPDRSLWPPHWQRLYVSDSMRRFRSALQLSPGTPVRESVIDDLCTYFHCTPDECVERCVNWGAYFNEEWDSAGDAAQFHRETTSSAFSLLWWAYCQSEGYAWCASVGAAESVLAAGISSGRHLDFAAATGVTSQLFARLGFDTTLADIATNMLDFARFRFERRGAPCTIIDLNEQELPQGEYDVITALAVLWLVPDFDGVAQALHGALKPGGLLFADIEPSSSSEARWQMYNQDVPLRRRLQAAGFEPVTHIRWGGTLYRRVPSSGPLHVYRSARDRVLLSPLRQIYRNVRDRIPHAG